MWRQTQGQRKRLQVSASVACFVVSGKVIFIVAHLGHITAIYIFFVIPSKRKCGFVSPSKKINPLV